MTAVIIAFASSLVLLSALLSHKVVRIRTGKAEVPYGNGALHARIPLPRPDLRRMRRIALSLSRKYLLLAAITVSKLWIVAVHLGKKKLKEKYPGLLRKLRLVRVPTEHGTSEHSVFLHAIAEYKAKMRRFKEKIREREMAADDIADS